MDARNAPLPRNSARAVSKLNTPGSGGSAPRATKTVRRKRRPLPTLPTPRAIQARTWGLRTLIVLFAFACGPLALWSAAGQRALPAVGIGCILFLLLQRSPAWGVFLSLLYVSLLGGIRRWLVPALGWTSADPLLLVAPTLVSVNFLNMLLTRRVPTDTRLARSLLWLLAIMFLEIFNPLQGSLSVGLAGVLFTIVPVLWYYYGKQSGSEALLRRLLAAVVGIALLGALYGLYQTYFGLIPSEKEWLELNKTNYNAIYVTDTVFRVFSFFTSSQEYMQVVSIGMVVLWAAFLRGARLALLPIPFLGAMIFLSSQRGAVLITLFACMVVWAVQGRSVLAWGPRFALALILAAGGLTWSLEQAHEQTYDTHTQALVTHQVNGLLASSDPNRRASTAGTHAAMAAMGVVEGFRVPIGRGLGSTTIASSKFDESSGNGSTEVDVSDAFAALGFAGGLIYLGVIFFVLSGVIQLWRMTRSFTSLATLGVLVANIGHWLHGGSYAATMVVWFLIGGMERSLTSARSAQTQAASRSRSAAEAEEAGEARANAAPAEREAPENTPRARWQARQKLLLKPARPASGKRTRP